MLSLLKSPNLAADSAAKPDVQEFIKDKSIYQVVSRDKVLHEQEDDNYLFERREYFDPEHYIPNLVIDLEPAQPPVKKEEEKKPVKREEPKQEEEKVSEAPYEPEQILIPEHTETVKALRQKSEVKDFKRQPSLPRNSSYANSQFREDDPWMKIAN